MKKKVKEDLRDSEVFLLSFIGEKVQILTDFVLKTQQVSEDSDGSLTDYSVGQPLIVEGYMLDSDTNYVYLGPTANQVGQAIRKERIVFIQVLEEEDVLSELINSLGGKSKREMN